MELIYLWTKKYKNLEGGYELSAKYNIDTIVNIEEKIEIIKLTNNTLFIDKFFDEKNKINITAIIGENGSGKSSIMKLIIHLLYVRFTPNTTFDMEESFVIFEMDSKFYHISSNTSMFVPSLLLEGTHKDFTEYKNEFYTLYFNYMLDSLKDNSGDDWIDNIYHKSDDYTMPILLEPYKKNNNIDINNLNYLTRQRMVLHRNSFKNNIFLNNIFDPVKVKISVDADKLVRIFKSTLNGKYSPGIKKAYKKEFFTLNEMLQKIEQEERNIESVKKRFKDNIQDSGKLEVKSKKNIVKLQDEIKMIILNNIPFHVLNNLYIAHKIDKYHKYRRTPDFVSGVDGYSFNKHENKINILIDDESHNTLKLRNAINYQDYILNNTDINSNERESYIAIDDPRLECLPSWFEVSFFDKKERTFTTLSAGEKSFYILLTTLIYQINNIKSRKALSKGKYKNILIMLDEADLGLHPKWQRDYLYNIVETLNNILTPISFHVICTSHSPFIISDLPKDNILFLDKGISTNLENHEYTFSENIHTLLNDSFFMKRDMMMGKIAENKIKKVFDFFEKIFTTERELEINSHEIVKLTVKLEKKDEKNIVSIQKDLKKEKNRREKLLKQKVDLCENYKEKREYFIKLKNIIGEEYIQLAFKNSIIESDIFFEIRPSYVGLTNKEKILQAIEENSDLVDKWINDINDKN